MRFSVLTLTLAVLGAVSCAAGPSDVRVSAPELFSTTVWQERNGVRTIQLDNLTQAVPTDGAVGTDAREPLFYEDLTLELEAPCDVRAVACGPDYTETVPLVVMPLRGGRVSVKMPKALVRAHATVRIFGGGGDAARINAQIAAACVPSGSRRVVLPARNPHSYDGAYHVGGTIRLPSDFTLTLDGARLVMEPDAYSNMFANERAYDPSGRTAEGADRNIVLEGRNGAVIDGGEYNGLCEQNAGRDGRPPIWVNNLVLFANVRGFRVSGISFRNQRWWALNVLYSSDGVIRDVDFRADCHWKDMSGILHRGLSRKNCGLPRVRNADGVDIRCGCHDIIIENVTGFTEDDTVALTALRGRVEERFAVAGVPPAIERIAVRNVRGASYCAQVRLLAQGGAALRDVAVDGVEDLSDRMEFLDRCGCGVRIGDLALYGPTQPKPDELCRISVGNVRSRAAEGAVVVTGEVPDLKIGTVEPFGKAAGIVRR